MTQNSMRIGLVTPGWPGHNTPNGIATAVYHMAMGLKAAGHQPVILAIRIDGDLPEGIEVVEMTRRPWSLAQKLKAKLGVPDIAQTVFGDSLADAVDTTHAQHGLDVVIVEETQGWANAMIARTTVPVVVFLHGPWILHKAIQSTGSAAEDARREAREAEAFRSATALISPSQNVLDAVKANVDVTHIPSSVIYNSYEAGAPVERSVGRDILFVGRFDRHKGGDVILEAFRQLHARYPKARLTFAGPDRGLRTDDGQLIQMADVLRGMPEACQTAITAPGRQTTAEVASLRKTHPIAVIASRYENLNYTMLEAMAAGQAIVSTKVGGPAEVFEDGKTALLVPSEDPSAMADALARLLEEPARISELGQAARAHLERDFAPQVIAERTVNFIRDAL